MPTWLKVEQKMNPSLELPSVASTQTSWIEVNPVNITLGDDTAGRNVLDMDYTGFITEPPSLANDLKFCNRYNFIVYSIVHGVTILAGLFGNALAIFTMWPKRNRNATSFILICLAIFDDGLLLLSFWLLSIPFGCTYFGRCIAYKAFIQPYLYAYVWPLWSINHMVGTWIVLLVTTHRYIAVCYPLKVAKWGTTKMARIQVSVICICVIIFVSPRFFDGRVVRKEDGSRLVNVKTALGRDTLGYGMLYNVVLYYMVIYIIPFACLIFMTRRLIISLKVALAKRHQMTKTKRDEEDMTLTLVVVVLVFMICQVTNPLRRLFSEIYPSSEKGCGTFYFYYSPIGSFIVILNSASNFIIYCIFGRRFRQTFKQRMNLLLKRGIAVDPNTSVTLYTDQKDVNRGLSKSKTDQECMQDK